MPRRKKNTHIKEYKLKSGAVRYKFKAYLGMQGNKKIELTRQGFKSFAEANAAYNKVMAEDSQTYIKPRQIKLSEVYENWFEIYKTDVKESTAAKCDEAWKNHLKSEFGDKYVDKITGKQISNYFISLSKQMINYKIIFYYLRRMLEYCVDLGYLENNPAKSSLLPKRTSKQAKDLSKNFYETPEEVKEFLEAAKQFNERPYIYFAIIATTGLRKGEALALTWNDIDFKNKIIHVNKTLTVGMGRKQIIQKPKTKKSLRDVPLSNDLAVALKKYRKDLSQKLFHKKNGDYLSLSHPPLWLRRIYKLNPSLKQITTHGFRHTFTTLMIHEGMAPKDVQVILGHSKLDMTLNTYTHSTEAGRENIRSKVNELF